MEKAVKMDTHGEILRKIPIVVGVTGHRDLREEDIPVLRQRVSEQLRKWKAGYPYSTFLMLSCLAEGADQLCAEEALKEGYSLTAVLPMPAGEYEKSFEGEALDKFRDLLSKADKVLTTTCTETKPEKAGLESTVGDHPGTPSLYEDRDYYYRQADIYLAVHSHILLALWNGQEGKPGGCGAAETVEMKLRNAYEDSRGSLLHPEDGAVLQIVTPRRKDAGTERAAAGEVIFHGDQQAFQVLCERTEEFNRDWAENESGLHTWDLAGAEAVIDAAGEASGDTAGGADSEVSGDADGKASGDTAGGADPQAALINGVYGAADALSLLNQKKEQKIFAAMSVAGTLVTMAFLLYDEATLYWMILVCGFVILAMFAMGRIAERLQCHRKYPEYRVLAETLRVQFYTRMSGNDLELSECLPWTLQIHTPWVRKAIAALSIGSTAKEAGDVRETWILDQKKYHERALRKTQEREAANDRIGKFALIITICSYLAALVFEITVAGLLGGRTRLDLDTIELFRTILKIVLGTLSAGTLFTGNYYGKLSLPQTIEDHRRMIALYAEAEQQIERSRTGAELREILERLALESLAENSGWYVYQSMNTPDMSL